MHRYELYPLKFNPILFDKIWGGSKLSEHLSKPASQQCGESWELSGIPGHESVVINGRLKGKSIPELLNDHKENLVGTRVWKNHGTQFPILLKFIDAKEDLSIQVHPNDEQSNGLGKTEMWYIVQADEGATLLSGFKAEAEKTVLKRAITDGNFDQYMNRIPVEAGDTFFIEANQVHTIGKGILLAEIQQSSDITYRIYDFNRRDQTGKLRDLHIDQAFEVMDVGTKTGQVEAAADGVLVSCPEFTTKKITLDKPRKFEASSESFKVLMNVGGNALVKHQTGAMTFNFGETIFLPPNTAMEVQPVTILTLLEVIA